MLELFLTYFSYTYFTVGMVLTLYAIVIYFFTGIPLFKEANLGRVPFRHKVSYVVVVFFMLPVFYIVFLKEIFALKGMLQEHKS